MKFDLEALRRHQDQVAAHERRRRLLHPPPEAVTFSGEHFQYLAAVEGDHVQLVSTDWVYRCFGCEPIHVIILVDAARLTEQERDERMTALGWRPTGSIGMHCSVARAARPEVQA